MLIRRLLPALALAAFFAAAPAWSSVLLDGANDSLTGTPATQRGDPMTFGAKIRIVDHPIALQVIAQLGSSPTNSNNSYQCRIAGTNNDQGAAAIDSGGTSSIATAGGFVDDTWISVICTFAGDADRTVRTQSTSASNTTSRVVTDTLNDFIIGESLSGPSDFAGRIAEVAVWTGDLSVANEDAYVANNCTAQIDSANQILYYSLKQGDANALNNMGTDAGGDLTANGNAALDADHPTMGVCQPTWDTAANVQSQTDLAYTIQYDASADAVSIFCAAYPIGTAEQTGAAIEAGTGARGTATEAADTGGGTLVLTPTDSPRFWAYEPQCVLENASGYSTVISLPDEPLDIPAGKQRLTLTSVHATSPYSGQGVAAGDTCTVDTVTDPGSYVITDELDGTVSYASGGNTSRQLIDSYCYDVSSPANLSFLLVYNNGVPRTIADWPLDGSLYLVGSNPAYNSETYVFDPDGDDLTWSLQSGSLPTNWSLNTANGALTGTGPGACGIFTSTLRATDIYGDVIDLSSVIDIGDTLGNLAGMTEAAAEAAVDALCGTISYNTVYENSGVVAVGNVIRTAPPASVIGSATVVSIVVSLGATDTAVPNIVGTNIESARAAIAAALLVEGTVTYVVDPANIYTILAQNPSGGTVVAVGGTVSYTVGVAGTVVNEPSQPLP